MSEWVFLLLALIAGWVCFSCVFALALGQLLRRLSEGTPAPPLRHAHTQTRKLSGRFPWPASGPNIPKPAHAAVRVPRPRIGR
jgi:hypothetical protein